MGWESADDCANGIKALMEVLECNQGCIPKGVKLKVGKPLCCTEGHESLKCPGPAHYHCGVHALRSNQTAATATVKAPPAEQ